MAKVMRERSRSGALSCIPPENLLIGVPKKGRLHEQCIKLLVDGAGLDYRRPERVDIAHCKDAPVCVCWEFNPLGTAPSRVR